MKTTLKYFWKTLLMLFIFQEIIFLFTNYFKVWWLHLIIIVCIFILFLIIHKFKDKIIFNYLNDKDRPHICSRDMSGKCFICGDIDENFLKSNDNGKM
jgi:c-di-AMP phosphodiesterase-like protein